jgi:hypothetical protein
MPTTIIAKYSDYVIDSINFFVDTINEELAFRDIPGLTNNNVEIIKVTKQHPLVTLMAAQLQENRNLEAVRSGILPAISVTPGNPVEEGFTLGQTLKPEIVDEAFVAILKNFLNMTDKEIRSEVLISKAQIELILGEYKRNPAGTIRAQVHEWRKNEEINISVWNETPDLDIRIGNIMDSLLADLQVGFVGDDSKISNMKWKPTKGLTNFNFGRVLFGTEYNLTFMNTYNNYTIYSDEVLSGHDFVGTFVIPGEEA